MIMFLSSLTVGHCAAPESIVNYVSRKHSLIYSTVFQNTNLRLQQQFLASREGVQLVRRVDEDGALGFRGGDVKGAGEHGALGLYLLCHSAFNPAFEYHTLRQ